MFNTSDSYFAYSEVPLLILSWKQYCTGSPAYYSQFSVHTVQYCTVYTVRFNWALWYSFTLASNKCLLSIFIVGNATVLPSVHSQMGRRHLRIGYFTSLSFGCSTAKRSLCLYIIHFSHWNHEKWQETELHDKTVKDVQFGAHEKNQKTTTICCLALYDYIFTSLQKNFISIS